ncbi:anti-sigma factor [Curtobacterium sp. MCPF17_047]|uniref:anti-sigma factor family protein n=1 Tax=unclassified Curtobacterium TaxID=257496 RepID=UPI000DA884BB|nr:MULTISPECIES: zf-HC2 domain-containing protein [unclassified Curtobacterium]PZF68823.1 anti-sigma factor [Curtobacterium sp. MCPF17_047]WIB11444.1 zf-HC2 domain-containing protein [Curtobacterium sp. MCPF17_052]
MSDDRYAEWDAAYVLGSLPPAERLEYERHLEHCDACRSAVAELAGLPGLLGRLPADAAVEIAEPDGRPVTSGDGTLASVAHRVRRRRRRRRVLAAAGAGVVVAVAVVAGLGLGLRADGPTPGSTDAARPPASAGASSDRYTLTGKSGFDVDLAVRTESWGTRFDWGCSYGGRDWASDGSVMYDLVVVRTDGSDERIASWTAAGREARGLSATTDVPRADIASVEVRLRGETGTLARTDL